MDITWIPKGKLLPFAQSAFAAEETDGPFCIQYTYYIRFHTPDVAHIRLRRRYRFVGKTPVRSAFAKCFLRSSPAEQGYAELPNV